MGQFTPATTCVLMEKLVIKGVGCVTVRIVADSVCIAVHVFSCMVTNCYGCSPQSVKMISVIATDRSLLTCSVRALFTLCCSQVRRHDGPNEYSQR